MASLLEGQSHFFSTQPQELTESDAEYVIACVKHVFTNNVILQYQIANSIEDQILSKVQVKLTKFESASLKVKGSVPLNADDQIKYGEKRFVYVVLERQSDSITDTFMRVEQILQISITEIDVDT